MPYGTTGGLDTVAVRMPSDPVANCLIHLAGVPVAASCECQYIRKTEPDKGGTCHRRYGRKDRDGDRRRCRFGIGVESTIVDVSSEVPTLLRPGAITIEMLRETLGQVDIDPVILGLRVSGDIKPKAPGMKYRHYAPKADMTLVEGDMDKVVAYINDQTKKAEAEEKKVGIICTEESRDLYPDGNLEVIGSREHEETVAHNLFAVLRDFDARKVDCIFSESFSRTSLARRS